MFSQITRAASKAGVRNYKVAVLGASGGIGQPLALLLKMDPKVTELSLFDVVRTPGIAADISHCCTTAKVKCFMGRPFFHYFFFHIFLVFGLMLTYNIKQIIVMF